MNQVTVTNLTELPYAMEEAVNRLRVNVGFLGEDIRKVMIISTFPDEGKSLVALQLWRQMAEAGISTVFLDADMRKSVLNEKNPLVFAEADKDRILFGTSQYLSGESTLEETLCHTQFPKGDLIYNIENTVNPSMLLESKRFTKLLDYLSENYRYVFLDTPPLSMVSDGERIGSQCDGALLVVRSGETPTSAAKASIQQLERAGCPVLGVVLNRAVGSKSGYYSKKYGGYGYGYYGGEYYYGK